MTTTALTTRTDEVATGAALGFSLVPHSFDEAIALADKLARSKLLPAHFQGKPDDCFWALAYGMEIGLPPVASLRLIYVVHGRPGLYADAMVGLVLSKGVAEYFVCVESSPERAVYETKRRGAPGVQRKAFTMEDAKTAGLTSSDTYKKFPARMLEARAKAFLARDVYPDVLGGMSSVEELESIDMVETSPGQFSAPPPSVGKVIEMSSSAAPPATEKQPEAKTADAVEDLAAQAKELGRRITEASTSAALEEVLPDLTVLGKKLGKTHATRVELGALYKAQKALVTRAETPPPADEPPPAEPEAQP